MSGRELYIPGPVVPKARPRFNSNTGRAYHAPRYRDWLDMATDTVAIMHRGAPLEGPTLIRVAFTPAGADIAYMPCSPVQYKGRRGDIDNMAGSCLDALQKGGAIANDCQVVKLEAWFV